jgi:trimeric autotransporter adhesin
MSMRRFGMRASTPVGLVVLVLAAFLMMASSASATEKLSQGEIKLLKSILPHITYMGSGLGGKPTIRFSGVNVQIVNGDGKTRSVNGEGNLVIGYDESENQFGQKFEQTGSHDLVLGELQTFTSFGGIVGGFANGIKAPFTSVTGGELNIASEALASVSGGEENTASGGLGSSVSGGVGNIASGDRAWVGGGDHGVASGQRASVSGGHENAASGPESSVSGGTQNKAVGREAWVGGGFRNNAEGNASAIFAGKYLNTTTEYEAIP